ncbi:hypothetical protein BKA70DRAFT_1406407 [Coprinopsis sp. MPI-PUGE-AT-0042]|nr:hypothetical protein BKA70DRAFT_1406407 [Coprinopsis sp. MPI-PUGE-AT-0042]
MARTVPTGSFQFHVQFASLAVLHYDYLLTLPDEIDYVWRSRWRLSTLFYIFCRYALVANFLYSLSIIKGSHIINCDIGYMICGVLSIFGHIGIIAVWGLRTYAVWQRNKYIIGLLGLPGVAVIILLIVRCAKRLKASKLCGSPDRLPPLQIRAPFNRCKGAQTFKGLRGVIAALVVVFEISAFLFATARVWRTMRARKGANLGGIVFSQGLIYMVPTFTLSMVSLVLNWKFSAEFVRLINAFKLPLAGLLTARFLLNLRKWEAGKVQRQSRLPLSTLRFAQDPLSSESAGNTNILSCDAQRSTRSMLEELGEDIGAR